MVLAGHSFAAAIEETRGWHIPPELRSGDAAGYNSPECLF
jgi:hypothetical protein